MKRRLAVLGCLATLVAIALVAAELAHAQGSIVIYDILSPGERKQVEPDWRAIDSRPLGTRENPVRAFQPDGQRDYLRRLVCPDGSRPAFRRIGSIGAGPYTSILDDYEVRCGDVVHRVIMDMYHPGYVECRPVPGFGIRANCPSS